MFWQGLRTQGRDYLYGLKGVLLLYNPLYKQTLPINDILCLFYSKKRRKLMYMDYVMLTQKSKVESTTMTPFIFLTANHTVYKKYQ